ncbi:FkbM family methyltransferase [Pseudovibrio exalbescens]|uniref:FkbM family methyltransferase n=1 Tax=Pseudovibrio exalbescens TaxID=197461 RepID=UPI0023650781|nr:FkbM family methyltransferase [Pseudovibrio exalbescens]MDD7909736.1 FkbM family methyltransferase [Pseudovibrio exalbescens]
MNSIAPHVDTQSPFGTYQAGDAVRFMWRLADQHKFRQSLRKFFRRISARFYAGPYDTEVEGLRFRIYPGENYDDRKMLAKGRLPEKQEHKFLQELLKQGETFVDVGANVGTYSLFAAKAGMKVVSLEANPVTASKLQFNADANGMDDLTVIVCGAGAQEGTLNLWLEPTNSGFATMVKDLTTGQWAGDWKPVEVQVRPLEAILRDAKVETVDLLKIDVEGFEDRVLLPFLRGRTQEAWPRVILLETNCRDFWEEDCLQVLEECGYRVHAETQDNLVLVR